MNDLIVKNTETQICRHCGKPFLGREGKLFCSASHKSSYHNKQRQAIEAETKEITQRVLKNRLILKELSQTHGDNAFPKDELYKRDYMMKYVTSVDTERKTPYVYEFGLLQNGDMVRIIKDNSHANR